MASAHVVENRRVARESIPTLAHIFYEYTYIRVCYIYDILKFSQYTMVAFDHQNHTYIGQI